MPGSATGSTRRSRDVSSARARPRRSRTAAQPRPSCAGRFARDDSGRMPRMKRVLAAVVMLAAALGGSIYASQRTATAMAASASKWLASLNADQKQRATFAFDSDERMKWHFVPNEQFPRNGVQIKEMSEEQRTLAWDLLKSGVSARGFTTARAIMELENILKVVEAPNGRFARDHEAYQFTIFGTPGDKKAWGWRFEGHHVSMRFDLVDGALTSSTPSFFGSNPAEVRVDVPGAA